MEAPLRDSEAEAGLPPAEAPAAGETPYRSIFANGHAVMLIIDPENGRIVDANPAAERFYGWSRDTLTRMQISDVNTLSPEALRSEMAAALAAHRTHFEFRHRRADGSIRDVEVYSGPTEAGGRTLLFSIVHDISARKQAEDALRKLSRAVEESPESIVITNVRAEIEYVNDAFTRNTGYTREEAIGQNPRVLQSGYTTPETYRALWDTITSGHSWRGEFLNRRKDGSQYLEHVTITPIHDEHGQATHYVAVKQDITEQRRMEEELARHREHLEGLVASRTAELQRALDAANVANRAKSDFLTTMSHEIRTPMNGVIGLLEVLSHSSLTDEQTELVAIMRDSAHTLLRLIDDILDFSKIESGNLELKVGPVALRKLIGRVADVMHPVAEAKAVRLTTHIDADVPETVSSDALRLQQILLNLVSNAIKFSAGQPRTGRVELRAERPAAGEVRLIVTDNGIGMAPEVAKRIFEPFVQAESSTTRRFGGTGLGLSICARLVRLFDGRIDLRSLPGRGTRFIVTLPLRAIEATEASAEAPPAAAPEPVGSAVLARSAALGPILVAEDNEINRRVIERQLGLLGLQCEMAPNGREALERWRQGHYCLLLTDLHMPEMDGYELTARIRSEEPEGTHMPIIAVTANALRGEDRRCIDAGMDDFVVKPVEVKVLRAALARWLPAVPRPAAAPPPTPAAEAPPPPADTAPLFDAQTLPRLIGDESEVIDEFLADYRTSARETLGEIREACAHRDWRRAGDLGHRLKSSSRSVGAMRLGERCAALEQAGRGGDAARVPALVEALGTVLEDTLQAMDASRPGSIAR